MSDEKLYEETPENGTPKESKVKKFIRRIGEKIDDATYDYRLRADFDDHHPAYGVFGGTPVIDINPDITAEEHLDEHYIITLAANRADIKKGNLIKRYATEEVFHIALVERIKYDIEFDGRQTQVDALRVCLGDRAEKVDVIKVGDSYYLK